MLVPVRNLLSAALLVILVSAASPHGQTPQPFPRPGQSPAADSASSQPPPAAPSVALPSPAPTTQAPPPASPAPASPASVAPPLETLVFPPYPASGYLGSYDAGRGQRYYLFGTAAAYDDIVNYYRTTLDEGGRTVFREPPTHVFEVGRFRDETMAFPPGVTVKDWTWGGSAGYPNPVLRGEPSRFPTVIMIVPPPPGTAGR
jgi:hypothetical protein